MENLMLLDCTLRDGGYINDWNWGYKKAKDIISMLVKANIDIVEVGFLRDIEVYNKNITVCNKIEELKMLLPEDRKNTIFSAMAMRSNYDIKKLACRDKLGIDMIRITAHDYDIEEGMEFAKQVKDLGYLLSINPINVMGYSDEQLLHILEEVERIHPYQFSIVDTFGSMKRRDLDRIVSLVDNNLSKDIRVGLHLHENMALSFSLAQRFVDCHLNRPITVDGSLLGMGRIPGNLPIELIADYVNEYVDNRYNIDFLMDAIQDYIQPIKEKKEWGYTPAYFLSAKYNLHRNYAEYYIDKGDLTNRDINHILARIDKEKTTVFDANYAEELYKQYINNIIDDAQARMNLKEKLQNKNVVVIAPGKSVEREKKKIENYINEKNAIVISVNFVLDNKCDYAFFSNARRIQRINHKEGYEVIGTSNLNDDKIDYTINHNDISGGFQQGCNSLILLLNLLSQLGVKEVGLAGADGYKANRENYFDTTMKSKAKHDSAFNQTVGKAFNKLPIQIEFITESAYQSFYKCNEK